MTDKLPLDQLQEQSLTERTLETNKKSEDPSEVKKSPESFQEAVQELKEIVEQLENVQGDLDKSVALFQRGMFLAKWSEKYLDRMEEEITEIISMDDPEIDNKPESIAQSDSADKDSGKLPFDL